MDGGGSFFVELAGTSHSGKDHIDPWSQKVRTLSAQFQALKVFIKHMVGVKRRKRVQKLFSELGLRFSFVDHGEIELFDNLTKKDRGRINESLEKENLELLNPNEQALTATALDAIKEYALTATSAADKNLEQFLTAETDAHYDLVKSLILAVKGVDIEHYVVQLKIERAQELLLYSNQSITEIAEELQYSRQMLVARFKGLTGLAPLHFKKIGQRVVHRYSNEVDNESSTG